MAPPATAQPQALAGLGAEQGADHGKQVTAVAGGDPSNGVAGLVVGVGDALEHGVQRGERRS